MRNNIIKNVIAISVLLFSVPAVFAQDNRHEVSLSVAGGLSTLSYDANIGERKNGAGGNFGLGYTYFFIDNLGISSGVEFSLYKAEGKANKFNTVIHNLVDSSDGELYDHYSLFRAYKEKQDVTYINVPLMLQYQLGEENKFYARAGVKLGIPVKGKYKSSASEVVNKGFFHNTANWGETQEFMGFGTVANYSNDEDIDLNIACLLSAEAGMKWKLSNKMFLYTGAYIDYGVNDIVKGGHDRTFTRIEESPEALVVRNNSMLNSSIGYGSNTLTQQMTEKVRPISVGLTIRLSLPL